MTNVLVVSTVDHAERALSPHLRPEDAVKVVVPAVRQGFLDWLANDERAFAEAQEIAAATADALPADATEAKAGEADITLAIRDALATFPADEIVIALHPDREQEFAESKASNDIPTRTFSGLPVRLVYVSDDGNAPED